MYNLSTLYYYIDMGKVYYSNFLQSASLCSNIILDCDINNTIIGIFLLFLFLGVDSYVILGVVHMRFMVCVVSKELPWEFRPRGNYRCNAKVFLFFWIPSGLPHTPR